MTLTPREAFWDISDFATAIINDVAEIRRSMKPRALRRINDKLRQIEADAAAIRARAEEKGY